MHLQKRFSLSHGIHGPQAPPNVPNVFHVCDFSLPSPLWCVEASLLQLAVLASPSEQDFPGLCLMYISSSIPVPFICKPGS